jgi:hypothetical protein
MAAAEARRWRCCGAVERPYRAVRAAQASPEKDSRGSGVWEGSSPSESGSALAAATGALCFRFMAAVVRRRREGLWGVLSLGSVRRMSLPRVKVGIIK